MYGEVPNSPTVHWTVLNIFVQILTGFLWTYRIRVFKFLVSPIAVDFSEWLWAEVGVAWRRQPGAPRASGLFQGRLIYYEPLKLSTFKK